MLLVQSHPVQSAPFIISSHLKRCRLCWVIGNKQSQSATKHLNKENDNSQMRERNIATMEGPGGVFGVGPGSFDVGGIVWWGLLTRAARQHRLKGKTYRGYRLNRTPVVVEDIQTDVTIAVDLSTAIYPQPQRQHRILAQVNMYRNHSPVHVCRSGLVFADFDIGLALGTSDFVLPVGPSPLIYNQVARMCCHCIMKRLTCGWTGMLSPTKST
jgi:hypothetical protein